MSGVNTEMETDIYAGEIMGCHIRLAPYKGLNAGCKLALPPAADDHGFPFHVFLL